MYSFVKIFRKADQTRRYTIQTTNVGWEVREEVGAETTRHSCYQDWHRVERARLSIDVKVSGLLEQGWREV